MRSKPRYSHWDRRARSSQVFWFALLCLQTVLIGVGYVVINSAFQQSYQAAPAPGAASSLPASQAAPAAAFANSSPSVTPQQTKWREDAGHDPPQAVLASGAPATLSRAVVHGQNTKSHRALAQSATPRNRTALATTPQPQQPTEHSAPASTDASTADPFAALASYWQRIQPSWTGSWEEAVARQARPSAAEAGLLHGLVDAEAAAADGQKALVARMAYVNSLLDKAHAIAPCHVAISSSWAGSHAALRSHLLPWLAYHAALGVSTVYLLHDGSDDSQAGVLGMLGRVRLIHRESDAEAGCEVVQALTQAKEDGMQWLLHIDTHELVHPGHASFSLAAELCAEPAHVPAVAFSSCQGMPEAGDITHPFQQVTLFAPSKQLLSSHQLQWAQMLQQGQGKAWLDRPSSRLAVRVDAPGVHCTGPHLLSGGPSPRWQTPDNPSGHWKVAAAPDSYVLQYAHSRAQDVMQRAQQQSQQEHMQGSQAPHCSGGTPLDPSAPTIGSANAAEEPSWPGLLLSEGAPVACSNAVEDATGREGWCSMSGVEELKQYLLRAGLLLRLHAPQQLLRGQESVLQQRLASAASS